MGKILVVGATGTNGREILRQLGAAGAPVRALVRDPARAADLRSGTTELVRGNLDDAGSLDAALNGIDRAFFLAPVDQRYPAWFDNFLTAATRAGTPHVVKFSGMGAALDAPSEIMRQHGATDDALAASGLSYTILRPNSFFQNLLWSARSIKVQGAFSLPVGEARQSLVDVRDIARVAVAVLTGKGHAGKIYDVTGSEPLSYHDVAATLTRVLGRPVAYVDIPSATALEAMIQSGMPRWNAEALTDLYRAFATGTYGRTTDLVQRLTGKPPITFEQFARDHAPAFA